MQTKEYVKLDTLNKGNLPLLHVMVEVQTDNGEISQAILVNDCTAECGKCFKKITTKKDYTEFFAVNSIMDYSIQLTEVIAWRYI